MLDIKFIRENPDIVKENIKKKFQDEKLPLVDEVIELEYYGVDDLNDLLDALAVIKVSQLKKGPHA